MTLKTANKFNLKELYRELTKDCSSRGTLWQSHGATISFVAHIIFERYGKNRKRMLAGLYRLVNGYAEMISKKELHPPMEIRFAPFTFDVLVCVPVYGDEEPFEMKPSDLMRY